MGDRDKAVFEIEIKTTHRNLRGQVTGEVITRSAESSWRELEQDFIRHLRGSGFVIPEGYEEWERIEPEERDEEETFTRHETFDGYTYCVKRDEEEAARKKLQGGDVWGEWDTEEEEFSQDELDRFKDHEG